MLRFLYHTRTGRIVLKPLTSRGVSRAAGWFLSTRLSKPMIKKFVRKNGIDLADFESEGFRCFNDCFSRKIKEDRRPINKDKNVLISPCDGLLSAYRISGDTVLPIKQSCYTVSSLLGDSKLANSTAAASALFSGFASITITAIATLPTAKRAKTPSSAASYTPCAPLRLRRAQYSLKTAGNAPLSTLATSAVSRRSRLERCWSEE